MAIKLASMKADLEKEKNGSWETCPQLIPDPDVAFLVSSLYLPEYTVARDLLMQRLSRIYKDQPIPDGVLSKEVGKLFVDHILHDWRGIDEPFTKQTALQILTDPAYRQLVRAIEICAGKVGQTNLEFIETETKN